MNRFPTPGDIIRTNSDWEEYVVVSVEPSTGDISLVPRDGNHGILSVVTKNIPKDLDVRKDITFILQAKVKYDTRNKTYIVKGDA